MTTLLKLNKKYLSFLFAISLLIIFPRVFYLPISAEDVDSGWVWGLRYFVTHKQLYFWGKDVVYTYGPLGIFSTRNFPSQYYFAQFAIDIYIVFQLVYIYKYLLKFNTARQVALFCLVVSTLYWDINFLLQAINLFFLFSIIFNNSSKKNLISLIVVNCCFLLFCKLNTVLISIAIFSTIICMLVLRKKWWQLCSVLCLAFSLIYLFIWLFNVSFLPYLNICFSTITDYNYALYFYDKAYKYPVTIGIVATYFLLIILVVFGIKYLKKNIIKSLAIGTLCLFVFIIFKQGFIRADRGHFTEFFCFLPFVFWITYAYVFKHKIAKLFLLFSIMLSYLLSVFVVYKGYASIVVGNNKIPIINYVKEFCNYKAYQVTDKEYALNNTQNSTFDYLLNSCVFVKYNKSGKWKNRPAFQSIVAVSSYLDSINANNFSGTAKPDVVYYKPDAVDNRYFLWDEPITFKTILQHYTVENKQQQGFYVFKKTAPKRFSSQLVLDTILTLNNEYHLPKDSNCIYTFEAQVKETILGKVIATLYHPIEITVNLKTISDSVLKYRYILPMHNKQQLFANYCIDTINPTNFIQFINAPELFKPNVKSITFATTNLPCYQKQIRVKLHKFYLQKQ